MKAGKNDLTHRFYTDSVHVGQVGTGIPWCQAPDPQTVSGWGAPVPVMSHSNLGSLLLLTAPILPRTRRTRAVATTVSRKFFLDFRKKKKIFMFCWGPVPLFSEDLCYPPRLQPAHLLLLSSFPISSQRRLRARSQPRVPRVRPWQDRMFYSSMY